MTMDERADETMLLHPRQQMREHAAGAAPTTDRGHRSGDQAGSGDQAASGRHTASADSGGPAETGAAGDGGKAVTGTCDGLELLTEDARPGAGTPGDRRAGDRRAEAGSGTGIVGGRTHQVARSVSDQMGPAGAPGAQRGSPAGDGAAATADLEPATGPERTRRPVWARVLAAVLLAALGFAASVSIRSNNGPAGASHAGDADLVRILDGLDGQEERLRGELAELERAKAAHGGPAGPAASLDEVRDRAGELAVLAGTAPVQGRGIEIIIADPQTRVDSAVLVDALQELRGAGAEAMEINGVRIVVSTYVLDSPGGGIAVGGTALTPPYRVAVIGDSHTLEQAVQIPGGVLDTVASREGASATVDLRDRIEIRALRPVPTPRYARPAG